MLDELDLVVAASLLALQEAEDDEFEITLVLEFPGDACPPVRILFAEFETVVERFDVLEEEVGVGVREELVEFVKGELVSEVAIFVDESIRLRDLEIGVDFGRGVFPLDVPLSLLKVFLVLGIDLLVDRVEIQFFNEEFLDFQ